MPRWTLVQRMASSTHLFPEDPHRHLRCRGMTLERKYSVGDSKNAADEFSEKGRSADGGLRNGDLLTLKSAQATILPTASCDPENLSPRNFGTTFCWQKVVKRNFNFLMQKQR